MPNFNINLEKMPKPLRMKILQAIEYAYSWNETNLDNSEKFD